MKREPFRYGRGRCIFCGREPPFVKISKEHVFGDWLRELFPRDAKTTHTLGTIDLPYFGSALRAPITRSVVGQGHAGSKKVKVVCEECNSTWLSNLVEDAAKPVLKQLIAGYPGALTEEKQKTVALWAAKTIMTAEHINRAHAVVTQEDRTWLKTTLTPPAGWFIRIAPFDGARWANLGIYQNAAKLDAKKTGTNTVEPHYLGLTFIGVGHLFVLAFYSSWSRLQSILAGMSVPHVALIWPPSGRAVGWPFSPYVLARIRGFVVGKSCFAIFLDS